MSNSFNRMWDRYTPAAHAALDPRAPYLAWVNELLSRHMIRTPTSHITGLTLADLVADARDDLAVNPTQTIAPAHLRSLRLERLFHAVDDYYNDVYTVYEMLSAVTAIVDLEGGNVAAYLMRDPHRSSAGNRQLLHFVRFLLTQRGLDRARAAQSFFHDRLQLTRDDLSVRPRTRNAVITPEPIFLQNRSEAVRACLLAQHRRVQRSNIVRKIDIGYDEQGRDTGDEDERDDYSDDDDDDDDCDDYDDDYTSALCN
jgi:hypothetical protein